MMSNAADNHPGRLAVDFLLMYAGNAVCGASTASAGDKG